METLHEKIKRLRLAKRIGQSEIADIIGISRSAYIQIENGTTKTISIELGQIIAHTLEIAFVDLFDIETDLPELNRLRKENIKLKKDIEGHEKDIFKLNKIVALLTDKEERMKQDNEELKLLRSFLSLIESFQTVDNEFFAEYNKDIVKEDSLIQIYRLEVIENFFRKHGKKASQEIMKFQDLEKFKMSSELTYLINMWKGSGAWDRDSILKNISDEREKFISEINKG
jgi:transcriptional regulator with XRE-family HTH domain